MNVGPNCSGSIEVYIIKQGVSFEEQEASPQLLGDGDRPPKFLRSVQVG